VMLKMTEKKHQADNKPEYVAVIRLRSAINASSKVKHILTRLKLKRRLTMAVYKNTPDILGQLKEVKDYVTFGEIDTETLEKVIEKRGKQVQPQEGRERGLLKIKGKYYSNVIGLHPPRGGFERGGIKKPITQGGALGYRGDKIKELIMRML